MPRSFLAAAVLGVAVLPLAQARPLRAQDTPGQATEQATAAEPTLADLARLVAEQRRLIEDQRQEIQAMRAELDQTRTLAVSAHNRLQAMDQHPCADGPGQSNSAGPRGVGQQSESERRRSAGNYRVVPIPGTDAALRIEARPQRP